MTTGRTLFISSMVFGIVIALAYWWVAREITGTFLLGFMAAALAVIATYMYLAERKADLWGDQKEAQMSDAAGERLGTFHIRSPLPFWTAFSITAILLGIVINPVLAALGFLAAIGFGIAFIVQS